jgi:hypothetical protein
MRRRRHSPEVRGLEARDLPSVVPIILHPPAVPTAAALMSGETGGGGSGGGGTGGTGTGSGSGSGSGTTSAPPIVPGQGTPTPHEQAREAFHAAFAGPQHTAGGRFSDQVQTLYIRGVGTSSFFLHGNLQLAFVTPADPAAPITGAAVLQDKNTNSGGIVGLDLVADPGSLDRQGRPTRATFTADPNIYGGIFYFDTASGTVRIHYDRGIAQVAFSGTIYTNGLTSPLRNTDLSARGGRIIPRSRVL